MHMFQRAQTAGVALQAHSTAARWLIVVLQPFVVSAGEGTKHSFAMIAALV